MPEMLLLEDAPQTETPSPEPPAEAPKKKRMRHPAYWVCFALLCVFLIIKWLAYGSQSLCDRYLNELTPPLANALAKITYLCPVPVYELCIFAAILGGAAVIVLLILLIFLRKRAGYRRFMGGLMRVVLVIVVICVGENVIFDRRMMHSSVLGHTDYTAHAHDLAEVCGVYNDYIAAINETIVLVTRDENNHFIRPSAEQIRTELAASRKKLEGEFSRYQVDPPAEKTSLLSPFLDAYGITAYTVSPSMEIVFNEKYEDRPEFASIYGHEFSHFCGYWREDEANYLGYRLCMASDNPDIRYAGLLDLFGYISHALDEAYFGTDDQALWDHETDEYDAFCETLTDYTDTETLYLFICDHGNNYKLYHQLREEENVPVDKQEYTKLPEGVQKVVGEVSQSHWEGLQEMLGAHYYDGVVQLILDDYTEGVRQPFTHAGEK